MTETWGGYLLVGLLVVIVLLRFKSDWRSYLVIAGALLSLIVARKDDIGRLVKLPDAMYSVCLVVGIVFLVAGLWFFVLHLFQQPQAQPSQQHGPRPEIGYAFQRRRAAWSTHTRVSLLLQPPPEPGAAGRAFLRGLGAALEAEEARRHEGTLIRALYSYEVRLWNTGNQPLPDLPITIDLFQPPGGYLLPGGSLDETIIEAPSVTPPQGANVQFDQRGRRTLVGTCDLFNPGERLDVRFYTQGGPFPEPDPQVRVVARAPNLPPAVLCDWSDKDDEPVRPRQPDHDTLRRAWVLHMAGVGTILLGRLLTRVGGRIGFKHVVRGPRAYLP